MSVEMKNLVLLAFFCFIAFATAETLNSIEDYRLEEEQEIEFESVASEDDESLRTEFWSAIVPGTKWCGDGDIAKNYDDLGIFREVDMCCRDHDHCDEIIPGKETSTRYNLTNPKFYTRLHCDCDYLFLDCLKETNHLVGQTIGDIYFNILGTQCFREDHPATCERIKLLPRRKCIEYSYDITQEKLYQWFDVPPY